MFCHIHGIQSDIPRLSANQNSVLNHSVSKNLEGFIPTTECNGDFRKQQLTKANQVTSNSEMTANIPFEFSSAVLH
jgi:hypothetical protein